MTSTSDITPDFSKPIELNIDDHFQWPDSVRETITKMERKSPNLQHLNPNKQELPDVTGVNVPKGCREYMKGIQFHQHPDDDEYYEIYFKSKKIGEWDESSNRDCPEDLVLFRDLSDLIVTGIRAGRYQKDHEIETGQYSKDP